MLESRIIDYNEEPYLEQPKLQRNFSFQPQFEDTRQTQEKSPYFPQNQPIYESASIYEQSDEKKSLQPNTIGLSSIKAQTEPNQINSSCTIGSDDNTQQVSCFGEKRSDLSELISQLLPELPISQKLISYKSFHLNFFRKSKEEKQQEISYLKKQHNIFYQMRQNYISSAEQLIKHFKEPLYPKESISIDLSSLTQCKRRFECKKNIKQPKTQRKIKFYQEIKFYVLFMQQQTLLIKDNEVMFWKKNRQPESTLKISIPQESTTKVTKNEEKKQIEKKIEPSIKLDFQKLYQQVNTELLQQYSNQQNMCQSIIQPIMPQLFASNPTPNVFANNGNIWNNASGNIPIGNIPIGNIPIGNIPIGNIPIGNIFQNTTQNTTANNTQNQSVNIFANSTTSNPSTATNIFNTTQSNVQSETEKRYNTRSGRH